MAAPNPIQARPKIWQDLLVFLIVAFLFGVSAKTILKSAATVPHSTPENIPASTERNPASVVTTENKSQTSEKSTKVVHIGCLPQPTGEVLPQGTSQTLTTEALLFRITAQKCSPVSAISAVNQTTGEKLIVFEQEKSVSTHYFPLKPGKNRVQIEWAVPKAQKAFKVLEIERFDPTG